MADITPMLPKNFDVSKIRYSPVKKVGVAKTVYIYYGGDNRCVLQFPLMSVPYGLSDSSTLNKDKKDPQSKLPNYTMNVSFKGIEDSKPINTLFQTLHTIEDKIKSDVFANRVSWLNDAYDNMESVVSRLFSSNIQLDKDKETKKVLNRYPPTFRVKVPSASEIMDDGSVSTKFKFDSCDMNNNELDFASILDTIKGSKAQLIVQLVGLWFAGGKYGCTWKLISARFQVAKSVKYSYVEDSDDDTPTKGGATVESDDEVDIPVVSNNTTVDESEEDEESQEKEDDAEADEEAEVDGDEEEEEAPPPPPPSKKAVASKKTTKK